MAYSSHCNIYALHPRAVSALLTLLLHVCCHITHLWSYCMLSLAASDVHVTFQKSLTSTPASTRGDAKSTVLLKGEWVLPPPPTPSFLGKDKVAADVEHQRCTHFLYSSINYSTWVEWLEITASSRELSENDSSQLSYWNFLLGRPLVSHIYQKTARTC